MMQQEIERRCPLRIFGPPALSKASPYVPHDRLEFLLRGECGPKTFGIARVGPLSIDGALLPAGQRSRRLVEASFAELPRDRGEGIGSACRTDHMTEIRAKWLPFH